jgi:coenzyme F420 biosynthesis associated uncharacterized protein
MANAVSWETAQRVAVWVGAGRAPFGPPAPTLDADDEASLRSDFDRATVRAEELVVEATGLEPATGAARARVVDRAEWVEGNIASFRHLLDPVIDQLDSGALPGPLAGAARSVTGAQLGVVLGWMSTRVLGQYDVLFAGEPGDGNAVTYVGPNVVALERRHGFPPEQFRLWIALHEVTHRCQFTGVPWLRPHFLSLVDESLSTMAPDPRRFTAALRRVTDAVRDGRNPLDEAGVLGLVASPEQLAVIRRVQALMTLLEGHGDVTMDRAGPAEVPEADRFSRTLRERRKRANAPARLLQQLTGIDAKLRQYEQGERFVQIVEQAGGPALLARVWEGPEQLPSSDEIREPSLWVARMDTTRLAAG